MRKSFSLILSATFACGTIVAQNGNNWTVNGNNVSNGNFLGTVNNSPLVFKVNNQNAGRFKPNGNFLLNNFQGTNSGLVYSNQAGELFKLDFGASDQVLYGNGSWGLLPAAPPLLWDVDPASGEMYNTSTGGVSVNGAARFNGNVNIATLSSGTLSSGSLTPGSSVIGDRAVYVDPGGNLKVGPVIAPPGGGACYTGVPDWALGGNTLSTYILPPGGDAAIGTCDNVDFVLKANNLQSMWVKPSGRIGFGTANPGTDFEFYRTGAPNVLAVSANSGGGPQQPATIWVDNDFAAAGLSIDGAGIGHLYTDFNLKTDVMFFKGNQAVIGNSNQSNYIWPGMRFDVRGDGASGLTAALFESSNEPNGYATTIISTQNPNTIAMGVFNGPNPGPFYSSSPTFAVLGDGRVGVAGSYIPAGYKLSVNGKIIAEEVVVQLRSNWPDYVFSKEYKLRSLSEVESYIKENKHLPNVPAAAEVEKSGISTGEMLNKQMEKIEELTLYIIELQKQIDELKKESPAGK